MNWNSFTLVAVHFMSDFQTLIFNYIACDFYLIRIRGGKKNNHYGVQDKSDATDGGIQANADSKLHQRLNNVIVVGKDTTEAAHGCLQLSPSPT